jgi:release factor glutamine methyltransferase
VAVDDGAAELYREWIGRREAGEPVAYLLGEREFYGRTFAVDQRVLIPRPETEHLVEAALRLPLPPAPLVLDVGTGSGCVAVTLAAERPAARVVAADLSLAALALARRNARALGVAGRVKAVAADLTGGLDLAAFDLVASNPPYVDPADALSLSPEISRFEPPLALFAGAAGAAILGRLVAAGEALRPGAYLVLEIGAGQLAAVGTAVAGSTLRLETVVDDYAGVPRVVVLRRRS